MQSPDGRVPNSGLEGESEAVQRVSRREVLKLSASALAAFAGCESSGGDASSVPGPPLETAAESALASAHRRHRMAFLLGDADSGEACTLDCTASFYDHEYGGMKTWH